jgi:uncharacterized protein (DUF433 family)
MVCDPDICHGKPTFAGTRIMVVEVQRQIARGLAPAAIVAEWRGSVRIEAIAEAAKLRPSDG